MACAQCIGHEAVRLQACGGDGAGDEALLSQVHMDEALGARFEHGRGQGALYGQQGHSALAGSIGVRNSLLSDAHE